VINCNPGPDADDDAVEDCTVVEEDTVELVSVDAMIGEEKVCVAVEVEIELEIDEMDDAEDGVNVLSVVVGWGAVENAVVAEFDLKVIAADALLIEEIVVVEEVVRLTGVMILRPPPPPPPPAGAAAPPDPAEGVQIVPFPAKPL